MNYWHMQLHPGSDTFEEWGFDDLRKILSYNLVGCSGDPISIFNKIKKGDLIIVRSGGAIMALVEALEAPRDIANFEKNQFVWFDRCVSVKILEQYPDNLKRVYGEGWFLPKTVSIIDNDIALAYAKDLYQNFKQKQLEMYQNSIIELLKYKHQVILQGAPGTGKTRFATLLAEDLTKPKSKGSATKTIDNFFKSQDFSQQDIQQKRAELNNLLQKFQSAFPKDKLKNLTLEDYCIGTGSNDSFCWWIEQGLDSWGHSSPGTSRAYKIYWSKNKLDYSKHGAFANIIDNDEAMGKLALIIHNLVEKQDFKSIHNFLSPSFSLKILHSYYPEKYFPIYSEKCLDNVLKLLNAGNLKLNPFEKNLKIQEIYLQKKSIFNSNASNLDFCGFLFANFDLKGDIQIKADEVHSEGEYRIIQFHPAYSYEDFVRGITALIDEDNKVAYKVEDKILADFAMKAVDNPSTNYVLIIDEINRANLPAVLGELIYALEYRDKQVESMYATVEEGNKIVLPSNLYIIGTMNTADRSVGHIDYAIRRRFAFVDVNPDVNVIKDNSKALELFNKVADLFVGDKNYLASDFHAKDVQLGHSYFIAKDDEQLKLKLEYEIKPILREYVKDGVLSKDAEDAINKLQVNG